MRGRKKFYNWILPVKLFKKAPGRKKTQIQTYTSGFKPADTRADDSAVSLRLVPPPGPEEAGFQVGGFKSGLKPSGECPGSEDPGCRSAHECIECLCGRGAQGKVKNQPTSSLRRRRGEQRRAGWWVWVGNCINTVSSTSCSQTYLCAINTYIMQRVFICLQRLMWRGWHSTLLYKEEDDLFPPTAWNGKKKKKTSEDGRSVISNHK